MRVLFVSLDLPHPPDKGQRMRNLSILRALAAEQHEVTLMSFAESDELRLDTSVLRQFCSRVELVPLPFTGSSPARGILQRFLRLASPIPYGAWRFRSAELQARVREHVARDGCDIVIWDEAYNLENLVERLPVPVLLNSHDIMQIIWGRYLALEKNPLKRLYARLEHRKLCRWESRAHLRVSKVLAVSAHDAALLRALCPGLDVTVVPNTVDTDSYQPLTTDDGASILFVGGMDWFPNRDAAEFFVSDILPLIRKAAPGARFVVAGRAPSAQVRARLEIAGVAFLGRVPDIRTVLAEAAVCIVPLRIGSGVRWKILEAAAMAKPMVSTALGAEGLNFVDGSEIVLADDPTSFAAAVVALLDDPARRRTLGRAARARVESEYSFNVLRASIRGALSEFNGDLRPPHHRLEGTETLRP
jgi:glycosyltransferase involved in cell wall biosynthesis